MQDKYVADVGDFGKYGLLRCLTGSHTDKRTRFKIGVLWYLAPSCLGANGDGKHLGYLDKRLLFRSCDQELFDALLRVREQITIQRNNGTLIRKKKYLRTERRPNVREAALNHVLGPPFFKPDTKFHNTLLLRGSTRDAWWRDALESVRGCNLVFLDPDNGIRVRFGDSGSGVEFLRTPEDEAASPKHTYLCEVSELLKMEVSLVIYHHLGRHGGNHGDQIRLIRSALERALGNRCRILKAVRFRRGTGRAYFVLANAEHEAVLTERIERLSRSEWVKRGHMELAS